MGQAGSFDVMSEARVCKGCDLQQCNSAIYNQTV